MRDSFSENLFNSWHYVFTLKKFFFNFGLYLNFSIFFRVFFISRPFSQSLLLFMVTGCRFKIIRLKIEFYWNRCICIDTQIHIITFILFFIKKRISVTLCWFNSFYGIRLRFEGHLIKSVHSMGRFTWIRTFYRHIISLIFLVSKRHNTILLHFWYGKSIVYRFSEIKMQLNSLQRHELI